MMVAFCLEKKKLTGVPSLKNAPRAPFGPSVVFNDGIPLDDIGTVLQKSEPASKETYFGQHRSPKVSRVD